MRRELLAASSVCLAISLLAAWPARAQRLLDVIWARQAPPGTVITLDGVLDEPAWAAAESKTIRYTHFLGDQNGIPGSGFQEEGGKLVKDSTNATLKFLVVGNQLYLGITCPDSSIGGGPDFNRFDGLLMSFKDHTVADHPKPPAEYFYSWWYPDTCDHNPSAVDKLPDFHGKYGNRTSFCDTRSLGMIKAWDAGTKVHGHSNSDTTPDTSYVMEMRVNLDSLGYNVTQAAGDVVEFGISIYDCDWYWPINLARFGSNRTWWQSPWGRDMWYEQVQVWSKPSVTTSSGAVPIVGPDLTLNPGATTVTVNGLLTEPVWATADSLRITYNDNALRDTYPSVLKFRAGQYQAPVNGGTAPILNPGDATVKWFFKSDSLYLGFDVRDGVVQDGPLFDRWDGFIVSINDRVGRWRDNNLAGRRITFHVGPGGTGVAEDYLLTLRDTLNGAKFALALKPMTTVDTLGQDLDQGYTAELKIDLTKLGYPAGRGDGVLWAGFDLLDGDSFTPSTRSTGTRTWWGRQYENECCPAYVFMGTGSVDVPIAGNASTPFALLGNSPNPFQASTRIRYVLDRPGVVSLEVFDLAGRRVSSRSLGMQSKHNGEFAFTDPRLRTGLYLYRLKAVDPATGAVRTSGAGKMMLMH